jgi:hypothetical protein
MVNKTLSEMTERIILVAKPSRILLFGSAVTDKMTQYAVETRYPSWVEEITKQEYKEAIVIAARVVFWAEKVIK